MRAVADTPPAQGRSRSVVFFADTGALPSSGIVTVQEYGSSAHAGCPLRGQSMGSLAPRYRLVSTKTTTLVEVGLDGGKSVERAAF
jgi:hypothetical protein